ncbi:MAG: hypothetical protein JNL24_15105 [Bacteroidia bacterium]|nr:hypothetical protein [Bacteroidia bacterium]
MFQNNPYKQNCIIFAAISLISAVYLILGCYFKYTLLDWSDYAITTFNNVISGVLTSALLLFAVEWILYKKDVLSYGKYSGTYRKVYMTEVNDDRKRSQEIEKSVRLGKESGSKIKFIDDSVYHELSYYELETNEYLTELEYLYNGKYKGTVEYIDHDFEDEMGKKHYDLKIKPKCFAYFQLNFTSNISGEGNYKYANKLDFGIFNFQLDPENSNRILVYYKNTMPSGISEGYEIWERILNKNNN